MAVIDPTFDESGFGAWLSGRPPVIQELARVAQYNRWYRLKTTGQIVSLYSYNEDGTVTVDVAQGALLWWPFRHQVFGIDPADLEECEAPAESVTNE